MPLPTRPPDAKDKRWSPRKRRNGEPAFVSISDELYLATIGTTPLDAVMRVIAYRERAKSWKSWATAPVAISIDEFTTMTGLSRATVFRALQLGRDLRRIKVSTGVGRGHKSAYAVTDPGTWTQIKGVTGETLSASNGLIDETLSVAKGSHGQDRRARPPYLSPLKRNTERE